MKYYIILPLFILLIASCRQTPTEFTIFDPDEEIPGLDCILITDANSAIIGTYPDCDPLGQWIQTNLNNDELEILDFPDTVTTQLSPSITVRRAFAYPNPIGLNQNLNVGFNGIAQQQVKVKFAIVNESTQTVQQTTVLSDGSDIVPLYISNSIYTPGAYYRVYFQVLGDRDEVFIEGYGNIFICRSSTVENVEDCF